jgi:Aspartyl/Asparaginyl beta-hydroxylase
MIEKLEFKVDLPLVLEDINKILELSPWDNDNQIGLTHRPGATNLWKDGIGSLYTDDGKSTGVSENDFTELNPQIPETFRTLLLDFAQSQNIKLGRVRIMRALSKRGLTVHRDTSVRYHLVLKTNIDSFFGFRDLARKDGVDARCYHMPADSHFYKVDTTRFHFIYNGGKTERIHLVIVPR